MPDAIRKIASVIALLTLALSSGLHVVALQGIGYVRMVNELQKVMPLAEAIDLTLSGKEICGICETVDEIQSNTEDSLTEFQNSSQSTPLFYCFEPILVQDLAPRRATRPRFTSPQYEEVDLLPGTPPPKAVA